MMTANCYCSARRRKRLSYSIDFQHSVTALTKVMNLAADVVENVAHAGKALLVTFTRNLAVCTSGGDTKWLIHPSDILLLDDCFVHSLLLHVAWRGQLQGIAQMIPFHQMSNIPVQFDGLQGGLASYFIWHYTYLWYQSYGHNQQVLGCM